MGLNNKASSKTIRATKEMTLIEVINERYQTTYFTRSFRDYLNHHDGKTIQNPEAELHHAAALLIEYNRQTAYDFLVKKYPQVTVPGAFAENQIHQNKKVKLDQEDVQLNAQDNDEDLDDDEEDEDEDIELNLNLGEDDEDNFGEATPILFETIIPTHFDINLTGEQPQPQPQVQLQPQPQPNPEPTLASRAQGFEDKVYPLFFQLIETNDLEKLRKLLKYNFDINRPNADGNTALHLAVSQGNAPLVRLLIQYRPNAQFRNNQNLTPLGLVSQLIRQNNGHKSLESIRDILIEYVSKDARAPVPTAEQQAQAKLACIEYYRKRSIAIPAPQPAAPRSVTQNQFQ